jgi:purine-binding chemotaxis protein CheW
METREDTNRTCIIVVQVAVSGRHVTMGIIVDGVSEVMDIAGEQTEPAPSFGADVKTQFILGMGKVANKVIMLLDVDKVLSMGEVEALDQSSTE